MHIERWATWKESQKMKQIQMSILIKWKNCLLPLTMCTWWQKFHNENWNCTNLLNFVLLSFNKQKPLHKLPSYMHARVSGVREKAKIKCTRIKLSIKCRKVSLNSRPCENEKKAKIDNFNEWMNATSSSLSQFKLMELTKKKFFHECVHSSLYKSNWELRCVNSLH